MQLPAISQPASVLYGTSFSSYRIGDEVYHVGQISLPARAEIVLAEFPWMIVLLAVIFCYLMANLLWAMVRRRARARLQSYE
jgi:cellulose synthase (UDP-forming)